MEQPPEQVTYAFCGIPDVGAFYRSKNQGTAIPSAEELRSRPEAATSLLWAKHLWVARAVANLQQRLGRRLRVFEYGCGHGSLGFLKQFADCELYGADFNEHTLAARPGSGYDRFFFGDFLAMDLAEVAPFDVICSLDVYGHVTFADKDALIAKWRSVLAPDGAMIEGVETGQFDYFRSEEARVRFVGVDGHVGIEPFEKILERYRRVFAHAYGQHRFGINIDSFEIEKQAALYGNTALAQWSQLLATFTAGQRRAFDLAQGIMFSYLTEHWRDEYGTHGGFGFLIASDEPCSDLVQRPLDGLATLNGRDAYDSLPSDEKLALDLSYSFSRWLCQARGVPLPDPDAFGFGEHVEPARISEMLAQ